MKLSQVQAGQSRDYGGYNPVEDWNTSSQTTPTIKLSQLAGKPYISKQIPHPENFLTRIISNLGPNLSNMGAVGTLSGASGSEDVLPGMFQAGGNIAGGEIGLLTSGQPEVGAALGGTLGRTTGEFGRQTERNIFKGQKFDIRQIGKESAIGAGTETLGIPFSMFSNKLFHGPAGQEFKSKVGEAFGNITQAIREKSPSVHMDEILTPLRGLVSHMRENFEVHPSLSQSLEEFTNRLQESGEQKGGFLTFDDLQNAKSNLDNFLGSLGVYGNKLKSKGSKAFTAIEDLIRGRQAVSQEASQMAEAVGVGNAYQRASDVYGTVASRFPQGQSKHGILKAILEGGGLHSLIRGDIPSGIGNLLASEAVGSSPIWKGAYNLLKVGKVVPTAVSELISRGTSRS